MDNQKLELKIKEILAIENFFDMVEATIAFEKEYKTTSFFKKTKMPLISVLKGSKAWYSLQLEDFSKKLQKLIDTLNLENIDKLLSEVAGIYEQENQDILNIVSDFKNIVK